jgi:protein-L-isoaspartate(D-aspartate) O-methyltransferase
VPADAAAEAYGDYPLAIGAGQTISQPYIVAYMSELLAVQKTHKVLEVGTGSGYQAAVLSLLADRVYSIEIVEELGREAAGRLEKLGYGNVEVRIGNGYLGWPEEAPFDRIMLTAAPEEIPPDLLAQLAPNGILVAPVGPAFSAQQLVVVQKDSEGRMESRSVLPVRFVPMVQKPQN